MIDIHCHLIPGIDDGPATLESALALARALVEDGMRHVVCTPHVFPGRFENRRSTIELEFQRFAAQLKAAGIDLSLSWAGEVRLTPEVLPLLDLDELPFLGASATERTLLLEMPDGQIPVGAERFVKLLIERGIKPVIVHPERNRGVIDEPDRMEDFVDMGCYLQLTAGSLTGHFGSRVEKTARLLLDQGWVHAVASDSHNLSGRKPRMSEAGAWLSKHYGPPAAHQLLISGPARLCHMSLLRLAADGAGVAPGAAAA